jgi:CheY-like chemotaxis protein
MQGPKYKSVLLVDDSYIDNLISRKIIEASNFADNIKVINSAYEAISYLRRCLSTGEDVPEVVFLDIRMPEMNGFDFLKELYTMDGFKEANLKLFILSSSLDPVDLKRIREHQFVTKFIGKPLTDKALQEIV